MGARHGAESGEGSRLGSELFSRFLFGRGLVVEWLLVNAGESNEAG